MQSVNYTTGYIMNIPIWKKQKEREESLRRKQHKGN